MLREREVATDRLRCPWCQGQGAGERWVTCPNDNTPMHAACLAEFGICPICRQPVADANATTSRTTRRTSGATAATNSAGDRPFISIAPAGRVAFVVEALPPAVLEWAASVRRDYPGPFDRPSVQALWTAATVAATGVVWFLSWRLAFVPIGVAVLARAILNRDSGRPRASALAGPDSPPPVRELAHRLADGDRAALVSLEAYRAAAQTVGRLQRELEDLERGRLQHHRAALAAQTPIEDAQRIRGIGEGITTVLRQHGITNLHDLQRRGLMGIRNVGPKRRDLLATWASDRGGAIERLLRAASFPGRADLDRAFDAGLAPVRENAGRAVAEANAARERLTDWIQHRPAILQALVDARAQA